MRAPYMSFLVKMRTMQVTCNGGIRGIKALKPLRHPRPQRKCIRVSALIDTPPNVTPPPVKTINRNVERATMPTPMEGVESLVAPNVRADAPNASSAFEKEVVAGNVKYALVSMDRQNIKYQRDDGSVDFVVLGKPIGVGLIDLMIDNGVSIKYADDVDIGKTLQFVGSVVSSGLYWVIGGIIIYSFWTQIRGGGGGGGIGGGVGGARGFTAAKPPVNPEKVNVRFADVAGVDNAKVELMEVVEFLKNPEKFTKMGAKIPKGCLLSGGPGLGKTLLAKAVAGEAGVPFFAVPASSFIELFVGVGSARVRDLFKQANASAPCIIFIDEIDAIGKARSSGGGGLGGNDEREQTINQLLTEMDGFTGNSGVVVIAATNRPDILDPALVRPGRFDRLITLDPPTLKDREAILGIHTKGKPLDEGVDLYDLAKNTVGLSGAELANIANEAAILAARKGAEKIGAGDFVEAIDRVLLGPEKKNSLISERKKRLVAAHEAGHAVVAICVGEFDEYDAVTKISIVPRGKSGGVTMFEQSPENAESGLYSRRYLENRLAVALGGRAAEEIVFGESNVTTGAYSDMEVVQQLARAMIVNYGFSEELGTASWVSKGNTFANEFSEKTMQQIDKEVSDMTKRAYTRAKNIIGDNMRLFNKIAEQLYEKEVLDRKEVEAIVAASKRY